MTASRRREQAAGLVTLARHAWHRSREESLAWRSPRRTALRPPAGHQDVGPSRFGAFGEGSWLVPPIRTGNPHRIAIGRDVVVLDGATLWAFDDAPGDDPLLRLGDGVRLTRFCTVVAEVGVTIGAGVASSDLATVIDTWRPPTAGRRRAGLPFPDPAPVVIGPGAYLGMSSIVGPGVHVGEGSYVGESAVVVDDVPPHSVVQGNPARVVRQLDRGTGHWEPVR